MKQLNEFLSYILSLGLPSFIIVGIGIFLFRRVISAIFKLIILLIVLAVIVGFFYLK